jgi:hypothetical protein
MVDLEILKVYAMTQKTLEDIETIMNMTQNLKFVISYNDPEIHRRMCENMSIKSCVKNECIFDSSKNKGVDFLIYSGKINLYILEKPGIRIEFNEEEEESSSEDDSPENKPKKKKKPDKKNKNKNKNLIDETDPKNLTLIRELKPEDCFGSFELDIMMQNNTRFNKLLAYSTEPSKVFIFNSNKKSQSNENKILSRRDLYKTQREINLKDKDNPKYYEPDIFLFDDPEKISTEINKVKTQVSDFFDNDQDLAYGKDSISEFKKEKEFLDVAEHLNISDLKETLNYVENKYDNYYNEHSIFELKMGTILQKSLNNVEKVKNNLMNDMDNLNQKYYDKKNNKNKNLIQLNIDNELKDSKFEDYVFDKLNKEKKLDVLLKQKKINDKHIEKNKTEIKKLENELLNTYYCIYCHLRPRNAMSDDCYHLVICDECIKKAKVCPRCGKNINSYHKIYRS